MVDFWGVVRCRHQHTVKLSDKFNLQGIKTFVPMIDEPKRIGRVRKPVGMPIPLLPGFIFFDQSFADYLKKKNTVIDVENVGGIKGKLGEKRGLTHFHVMSVNGKYVIVADSELNGLRGVALNFGKFVERERENLFIGDVVVVKEGVLKDYQAVVISWEKPYFVVELQNNRLKTRIHPFLLKRFGV